MRAYLHGHLHDGESRDARQLEVAEHEFIVLLSDFQEAFFRRHGRIYGHWQAKAFDLLGHETGVADIVIDDEDPSLSCETERQRVLTCSG